MMRHDTDAFLGVGGTRLFVQTWAPDDPEAVVVVAHGFAEHSGRYRHVAEFFAEQNWATAAMDLPGHGRSEGPRSVVDLAVYGTDFGHLREYAADRWDLPQYLLGHSMGGPVVLTHLVSNHEPVCAVALSAPLIRLAVQPPLLLERSSSFLARIAPNMKTVKMDPTVLSRDPAVVISYRNDPLVYTDRVPAKTGAEFVAISETLLPKTRVIDEPLLVMHGTADQLTDIDGSRELIQTVRSEHKTFVEYSGLYHELMNEPERQKVLNNVAEFFDEHTC